MWQRFSKNFIEKKWWLALALPAWVFVSFTVAKLVGELAYLGLDALGVPFDYFNQSVVGVIFTAFVYLVTLAMVIIVPWRIKKYRTSRQDLGLVELPSWLDILIAPVGFVVYVILSAVLLFLAGFLPWIDLQQVQQTGFEGISQQYEYMLAFVTLVLIAPLAEEILFRGYLLGKLMKHIPAWLAVLITSALFAFVHGAWNVGVDVFALSIVLCVLRIVMKSLWPAIVLHMIKNAVAFYFLFINPVFLTTLG